MQTGVEGVGGALGGRHGAGGGAAVHPQAAEADARRPAARQGTYVGSGGPWDGKHDHPNYPTFQDRLRFLRRQYQTLRSQNAEAQRALAAAEWERQELEEGAEASVLRVEEEQARKARELEARIEAVQAQLRAFEQGRGGKDEDVARPRMATPA